MNFDEELASVLPLDLPERGRVIAGSALHLSLIVEANRQFNLTRITGPREAAIKHVLDSVLPWRLFSGAGHVLDAGSGAGFPGIPLALACPEVRFTLSESTGKKARFLESAVAALGLRNVEVSSARAEEILARGDPVLLTARAVAPLGRAIPLFAAGFKRGSRALLYKGPDAETEIAEAAAEARRNRVTLRVIYRYELPDGLGTRAVVEIVDDRRGRI